MSDLLDKIKRVNVEEYLNKGSGDYLDKINDLYSLLSPRTIDNNKIYVLEEKIKKLDEKINELENQLGLHERALRDVTKVTNVPDF